jgi:Tetrahydrofolate dehydrogenase/cyclohydrolase, catalytic domain
MLNFRTERACGIFAPLHSCHAGSRNDGFPPVSGESFLTARIIDGKAIARKCREEIKAQIVQMVEQHGMRPGLSVILVGDDPASQGSTRS